MAAKLHCALKLLSDTQCSHAVLLCIAVCVVQCSSMAEAPVHCRWSDLRSGQSQGQSSLEVRMPDLCSGQGTLKQMLSSQCRCREQGGQLVQSSGKMLLVLGAGSHRTKADTVWQSL